MLGVLRSRGRRRVEQRARRTLAAHDDLPAACPRPAHRHDAETAPRQVRLSYIKVAEYQRRGLVHLHAVVRLDQALPAYRAAEVKPPPARFTVELLEDAIRATAADVRAPLPGELGGGAVSWGGELDIRRLDMAERSRVAGYLAKYATKSTELAGSVVHRVTEAAVDALPVREHVRAFCAPPSRSRPTPSWATGAWRRVRTRSATAATA